MLVTLAAYQPAWFGGMLWDDNAHLTRPELRSLEGLRRIWFDVGATQQYYPLVHSVFWVEQKLWAGETLGYHLLNIGLHALSAFLVAVILRRLEARGAILAAVIFALHPVQVESVAWMTELKNTLSGSLYLAAALVYLHFDTRRRKTLYTLALFLFGLALLSKTVTATLPAALLVVFWWQRGRLSWKHDVAPLLPFFVLGAAGGLLTSWLERTQIGAHGALFQFTFIERCLIAGRAIWFYLGKLIWPANLIFIYPRWEISQRVWWQYLYPLATMALLAGLWLMRKRSRAPLAAMLFMCGTLFPALGFFNVFPFQYSFVADHFQYLASLSIIALFAAGLMTLAEQWHLDASLPQATALLALAAVLGALTWRQSRQYTDAETLYLATLSRNPACWMADNNLGELKLHGSADDVPEAVAYFRETLRLYPDYAVAHNNLGAGLARMGQPASAIAEFEQASRLEPNFADPHDNMGTALSASGRLDEAIAQYQEALRINPRLMSARDNLGTALLKAGRPEEAIAQIREVLKVEPDDADAYENLGTALQMLDRPEEALEQYQNAERLNPGSWSVEANLGSLLMQLGRFKESAVHFEEALRLQPNSPELRANLEKARMAATQR
jgi:tetratricopeptide (TPR) repeat protein